MVKNRVFKWLRLRLGGKSQKLRTNTEIIEKEMAQSLKQKTELSQKLLGEISNWQIVDLPKRFFHGCHSTDINININQNEIAGNKWFSTNEWYAGTYAWHFSRQENPDENSRYCLELTARDNYKVILRPTHIASFPEFLRDCFPDVTVTI